MLTGAICTVSSTVEPDVTDDAASGNDSAARLLARFNGKRRTTPPPKNFAQDFFDRHVVALQASARSGLPYEKCLEVFPLIIKAMGHGLTDPGGLTIDGFGRWSPLFSQRSQDGRRHQKTLFRPAPEMLEALAAPRSAVSFPLPQHRLHTFPSSRSRLRPEDQAVIREWLEVRGGIISTIISPDALFDETISDGHGHVWAKSTMQLAANAQTERQAVFIDGPREYGVVMQFDVWET